MAQTNENGDWINARGKSTPPEFIDPIVKNRDRTVEQSFRKIESLAKRLRKEKDKVLEWIDKHLDYVDKKTGSPREGKGNLTLTNYSGDKQIDISISDILTFDERLQNAKALIDKCLHRWTEGAHKNLRALIDEAFEVDKKGKVNAAKILRLRSIKIDDDDWKKAIDLISDSIEITGSKRYIVFRMREGGTDGKWETVSLNFSSL